MNQQQCKDQIASKYGHADFEIAIIMQPSIAVAMTNELNTLYASEKVKEALNVVAERVTYRESRSGQHSTTILSLETELVNNIKNDK